MCQEFRNSEFQGPDSEMKEALCDPTPIRTSKSGLDLRFALFFHGEFFDFTHDPVKLLDERG